MLKVGIHCGCRIRSLHSATKCYYEFSIATLGTPIILMRNELPQPDVVFGCVFTLCVSVSVCFLLPAPLTLHTMARCVNVMVTLSFNDVLLMVFIRSNKMNYDISCVCFKPLNLTCCFEKFSWKSVNWLLWCG